MDLNLEAPERSQFFSRRKSIILTSFRSNWLRLEDDKRTHFPGGWLGQYAPGTGGFGRGEGPPVVSLPLHYSHAEGYRRGGMRF